MEIGITSLYSKLQGVSRLMAERSKSNTSSLNFQMTYPGTEAYHFSSGPRHDSPCMSKYWRRQPIREGKRKEE